MKFADKVIVLVSVSCYLLARTEKRTITIPVVYQFPPTSLPQLLFIYRE